MFTSHRRPTNKDWAPTCNCVGAVQFRNRHGWPARGDPTATPCTFCAFHQECLLRSKSIHLLTKEGRKVELEAFHSLKGLRLQNVDEGEEGHADYVQDVAAMQILWHPPDGFVVVNLNHHFILRLMDQGSDASSLSGSSSGLTTGMLTRARETGGGLLARKLIPDKVNYRLISEWLQLCRSMHVSCGSDGGLGNGQIPGLKVIDCTTGNIVPFDSLSGNTSCGEESKTSEYVTLSYVWGKDPSEGPVISQQQQSLPSSLPLTIRDTIQVVKRLGYKYLWIDRYCIPQDDPPLKHIQIKNMGRIFSHSVLTIIAAAGEGPGYGLPGVSERRRVEQLTVQVDAEGNGISLAFYEQPGLAIGESKWHTRGWTYQEGHLSRHRLVFTDEMVYFQCHEMHGDEVLSLPIAEGHIGGHVSGVDNKAEFDEIRCLLFDDQELNFACVFPCGLRPGWPSENTVWHRIEEFSERQLSFDGDTLDAVAGVFEMYTLGNSTKHERDRISFFYGLPIAALHRAGYERVWSCELQTFWPAFVRAWDKFEPVIIAPNSKEVDIKTTNLTYQLVDSLLWTDSWWTLAERTSDPSELLQPLPQFRRPMFPSWTWAGWKKCVVEHHTRSCTVFDSRTAIFVEYAVEDVSLTSSSPGLGQPPLKGTKWRRLDWERDNDEILELAQNAAHKLPARLVIRGTVLDMRLKWRDDAKSLMKGGWTVPWPGKCMEAGTFFFPRSALVEDSAEHEGHTEQTDDEIQALALVLAGDTRYLMLSALLLRPMILPDSLPSETIYQRVSMIELYVNDWFDKVQPAGMAGSFREMEVTLC